jgi:hypothetical protein
MGDASNVIDRVAARVVCNRYPWQGTTAFAHPCPQSAAGTHLHKFATSFWEKVDRQTAACCLLLRLLLHELLLRASSVDRRLGLIPTAALTTTPASDRRWLNWWLVTSDWAAVRVCRYWTVACAGATQLLGPIVISSSSPSN